MSGPSLICPRLAALFLLIRRELLEARARDIGLRLPSTVATMQVSIWVWEPAASRDGRRWRRCLLRDSTGGRVPPRRTALRPSARRRTHWALAVRGLA